MKNQRLLPTLVLTILFALPLKSAAAQDNKQTVWGFGPSGGFSVNSDNTEPFVGALFRFGPPIKLGPTVPLLFDGAFEYYFNVENATVFALLGSVLAQFPIPNSPIRPTAGAGVSLTHTSVDTGVSGFDFSDTSLHFNLQGGVMISLLAIDGILRLGDGTNFVVRGSVMFGSLFQ